MSIDCVKFGLYLQIFSDPPCSGLRKFTGGVVQVATIKNAMTHIYYIVAYQTKKVVAVNSAKKNTISPKSVIK